MSTEGKKSRPEIGRQQEGGGDESEEAGDEGRASPQRQFEHAAVALADMLEAGFEGLLDAHQRVARGGAGAVFQMRAMRLEQMIGHRRHQRARQDERADHREHDRFRHRHEQEARDAVEEEHRHEDDADAQQRDEGGRHDLARAVHDRRLDLLAVFEMPIDVLDRHRRVVDQNADRQRETAERHDVQRLADRRQRDDRAQHRQRNRRRDDQGRAPGAEEQQDHQAGQRRRDDAFARHRRDCAAHEQRLVAEQRHLEPRRQGVGQLGQPPLDAGDDRQRRGRAVLEHLQQHRTIAVDMDDVGLRRIAVAHLRDVAHIDHRAVDGLDRQVAEVAELGGGVVELHRIFEGADLLAADRRDQVLRGERIGDVLARQASRLQRGGVEIDLDLPQLAAERVGNCGAGHRDQRRAHLVDADVGQLLLGEALTRQRHLDDRHGRGVVVEDQRRRRAGRHRLDHGLRDRRHLRVGGVDVDARLKEDLDDAEAVVGIGLDMLDVVDGGGQRALEGRGDAAGHLVGRQAGVLPDDADHRNADVGEDVGRRAQSGERADDQDQQRQHDERIGARQRDANQGDHRKGVSVIANKSSSGATLCRPNRIAGVSAITLR